ncbi:MAG: Gfo/Idh/MocA family oxidoreductase [Candidatus Pacebacteria bacterium]|nr:Gfo/Idh/MocA family oxidoreductase [Candidatus Paceibacterota bacterium]
MAKPLQFGIVGCGVIAPSHIESLRLQENVSVTWVCDLVREKAESRAAKYGCEHVTRDYREVLDDPEVDAVCVCTDHASHVAITVDALDAGKHVLCEKALASDREGLVRMFAARDRNPEVLFGAVFQHRFDPEYSYLKQLIDEGRFGTLLTGAVHVRCLRTDEYYTADQWRGTWAEEGGAVLINQAIHFIDALLWVTGGVAAVCGTHANMTHNRSMEAEDTASAILRFRSGAIGTLEATCSSHLTWEPTLLIHGTEGSIELRDGKPIKLAFSDAAFTDEALAHFRQCEDSRTETVGKTYYGTGHPAQIADFCDAIRDGREPHVSADSARETVETVLAIYQSHREQGWVNL